MPLLMPLIVISVLGSRNFPEWQRSCLFSALLQNTTGSCSSRWALHSSGQDMCRIRENIEKNCVNSLPSLNSCACPFFFPCRLLQSILFLKHKHYFILCGPKTTQWKTFFNNSLILLLYIFYQISKKVCL